MFHVKHFYFRKSDVSRETLAKKRKSVGEMKWTQEQQQVIDAKNAEVLVSAAAGSGKTAVLSRRVAELVLHDRLVMEELLVLTFTRASAADMREKIEQQLLSIPDQIEMTDEERARIVSEARHLGLAQISTIDSYCTKIVREFFALVPIDPRFTICEEEDARIMLDEAVAQALAEFYAQAPTNPKHEAFITTYSTKHVESMLRTLFAFLMARPNPEAWLQKHCSEAALTASPMDGAVGEFYAQRYLQLYNIAQENLDGMRKLLSHPLCPQKYMDVVDADAEVVDCFSRCIGKPAEAWYKLAAEVKWKRLASVQAKNMPEGFPAFKEQFTALRDGVKQLSAEIVKEYPFTEQALADLQATAPHVAALGDLCRLLLQKNREIKRHYNSLTFADIAQAAYTLMQQDAVVERLRSSARAIFVDEYQDVSPLQEAMLQRLKDEHTRLFYVGDVKQSIYRFRNAMPMNFLSKMQRFAEEADAPQRTITLSRNFRSAPSVLDAANRVMKLLMRPDVNELSYDEKAWLYQGSSLPDTARTELHLVTAQEGSGSKQNTLFAEIYSVVQTIRRLHETETVYTDGEPRKARYDDFAVLMPRNVMSQPLQRMLELNKIGSQNDQAESFYERPEIRDLIEFLVLMDSPEDDNALLCVMKSWLFSFTSEELARIRIGHAEGTFAEAVQAAAENEADETLRLRLQEMLRFIEEERFRIHNCNLFLYLWDFVRRTGLYDSIQNLPDGYAAKSALDMIVFEAISFEESHFQGIFAFTERLRRRVESRHPTNVPASDDTPDRVHIMTIHKSKGLQFPFVLIMGLGTQLSGAADTAPIRLHDSLGTAIAYVNPESHTRRDTLLWNTIRKKIAEEDRAEYTRLLYVAMTRASQQTLLFGSVAELPPIEDIIPQGKLVSPISVSSCGKSMLYWLLCSIAPYDHAMEQRDEHLTLPNRLEEPVDGDRPWHVIVHPNPVVINPYEATAAPEPEQVTVPKGPNPLRLEPFRYEQRMAQSLPQYDFARLPTSVTPSQVNRAVQGGLVLPETEQALLALKRIPAFEPKAAEEIPLPEFREPDFDNLLAPDESPAAKGTATHILLQLCDFDALRKCLPTMPALTRALRESLQTLYDDGRITEQNYELADVRMAARFFLHPLGQRALHSEICYREKAFFSYYLPPLDSILLRGSMDLCFYDEGSEGEAPGWVILDYKTDFAASEEELLQKYAPQLRCYRQAVQLATGQRVKTCALFALRIGKAIVLEEDKKA